LEDAKNVRSAPPQKSIRKAVQPWESWVDLFRFTTILGILMRLNAFTSHHWSIILIILYLDPKDVNWFARWKFSKNNINALPANIFLIDKPI